jgi:type II secretory pathway component PulJ
LSASKSNHKREMKFAVGDLVFCTDKRGKKGERVMCSYGPAHHMAKKPDVFFSKELKSLRNDSAYDPEPYTHYYGACGLITRVKQATNSRTKGLYEVLIDGSTYIAEDYVLHRHMTKTVDHIGS